MGVSEKTVYRWIKGSGLPAFRINEQYRFSRAELLEWATARRVNVSPDLFREPAGTAPAALLADVLREGGVHYRVEGGDKPSVLKAVVAVLRLPAEVDRSFLLDVLMARESLGSTAVGNGVAIPHPRSPIVQFVPRPTIGLCFLETPIEFGALDGKPVHAIFTIVSPTVSQHLSLLSRLAHALRTPSFAAVIAAQGTREEILSAAAQVDDQLQALGPGCGGDGRGDRGM